MGRWGGRLPHPPDDDPPPRRPKRGLFSPGRTARSNICQACGRPGTKADPIVTVREPQPWGRSRIHRSHTNNPHSGFYRGR